MIFEKKSAILTEPSFETVLNTACENLQKKQIQHSIQRIREMDEELDKIEKELDEFLSNPNR